MRFDSSVERVLGALLFAHPVPAPEARRLNFAGSATIGLEYGRGTRRVAIEYMRHHTSNAATARVNPGLDANMLRVSWRIPWRAAPTAAADGTP